MPVSLTRAPARPVPTTAHRSRRGPAALVAVVLALAGTVLTVSPASAAAAPYVIDDFASPAPANRVVTPNGRATFTDTANGTKVSTQAGGGSHYVIFTWNYATPLDLTQAGAMTQLQLDYSAAAGTDNAGHVLDNPVMMGVTVTDKNGATRSRGGTGVILGSGKFVTNFTQQGADDVRYLQGTGNLTQVSSVSLFVGSIGNFDTTSISIDGFSAVASESAYTIPTFTGPTTITATKTDTINTAVTAVGYPRPTLLAASGSLPPGVTATQANNVTTFTGTPTANGTWTYTITTKTLDWLTNTHTVTFNVFTKPTIPASSAFTARIGQAFSQTLTVGGDPLPTTARTTFTPALPTGLTGSISGTTLTIAGTPTGTPGPYSGTVTVGNGYDTATGALTIAVQGPATLPALTNPVVAVGTAITPIQITGGSFPTPTVTVTGLPAGLGQEATTGGVRITGTPTATGISTVTVTADNGVGGPVTGTFAITVASRPTISAPGTIAATVGQAVLVPVTVTGFPDPTAVAVAPGLPDGLALSKDAGGLWAIRGVPTRVGMGVTSVTLQADNALATGTATTVVTVAAPPVISGPSTVEVSRGAPFGPITYTATGYPTPTLSLAAGQTLPSGITMVTAPGSISFSGTATQVGEGNATIVAHNSAGDAQYVVHATVGTTPVFAQDTRTITVSEGRSVSQTLTASSYPAATFAVTAGSLPAGLTLAANGALTGTPVVGSADAGAGQYAVTVTASNHFGSDTQALTLVVRSAPKFPAGLPTATFASGTAGTYAFTTGGWDRPAVTLLDALPAGLTLTDGGDADPATWSITGTVARALMGPHSVRIALDNAFGVRTVGTLRIEVTAPFMWETPSTDVIVETGVPITPIDLVATGYPIPTNYYVRPMPDWLGYTSTRRPGTPPTTATATSITYHLTGTPTVAGPGTVTVYPAFGLGGAATVTFQVTDRPVLAAPAAETVLTDTAVDIPVSVAGSPSATVTATGLPAGLSVVAGALPGGWHITGTVGRAAFGTYDVTLTADNGLIATRGLTLTVEGVPVLDDSTVTTYLGQEAAAVVHATGSPLPGLTVTGGTIPPGLTLTDDGSGGLAFTGKPTTPGVWTATVTATNVHGTDAATVTIEVRSAPVFTDTSIEQTLREGDAVDFTVAATGYPAHTVEIASGTLPAGLTLSPTGHISGTPAAGSADAKSGRYELVLRAWNTEGEDTVPVTLTVLSVPKFPAGLPTMSIDADTASSYRFTTGGWDRPTVTLLDPLPDGLVLGDANDTDPTTWQITGTVARALRGPHSVRVALDNSFGRVVQTLQIRVNAPLVWGEAPTSLVVETGVPITPLTITSTGYVMPNNYGVPERPAWLWWPWYSFNETNFEIRFEGTPTVAGPARLTLTPWGVPGPDITVTFLVTDRPVITAPASVTAAAGDPLAIDVSVSGSPVSDLTATGLPTGLTLVPGPTAGTWQVTGTPGRDVLGEHTITLTADNGLTTTKDLTLTVTGGALLTAPTQTVTMRLGLPVPSVIWTATGYPAPDIDLVGDLPPGVVATTGPTGLTLDGTPTTPGTWTVDVRTTNAYGTDTVTVYIVVADLPAFADETVDLVMIEGVPTTTSLPLRGFPEPTVDVVGAVPGLTVTHVPGSAPVLSGTPEAGSAGDYTLTLTARNTIAGIDQTDVVTVNVRVDARAAIPSGTDALVTTVGTAVDRTVRLGGAPEPTLTATGLPAGLTLARTAAGEWHLTGTPAVGTGGVHPVTLTATNGVLNPATATLEVTVREPVLAVQTPAAALRVGTSGTITVTTSGGWPTPPTLRIEGALPRGLSFLDDGNGTGRVVGTPASGTAGGWTVTVIADNGVGATRTSLTFVVTARPANSGTTTGTTTGGGTGATDGAQTGPGAADGTDGAGAGSGDGASDGSGDASGSGDSAGDGSGDGTAADDGGDAAADAPPVIDVPVTVTGPGANPWWWALASLLLILAGTAAMVYRRLRGR